MEALEACQAHRKEDTLTLATAPALPGDPSLLQAHLFCHHHSCLQSPFSQKRLVFQMSCLLAPSRCGARRRRLPAPEVWCTLQAAQSQVPQRSGTCAGRCPCADCVLLSLWRFVFFLRCCLREPCCPLSLLVLKLQAALSEGGTPSSAPFHSGHPPLGEEPQHFGPLGAPGLDPQASVRHLLRASLCHTLLSLSHTSVHPPRRWVQRGPLASRGHESSNLCLVTPAPSAFVS